MGQMVSCVSHNICAKEQELRLCTREELLKGDVCVLPAAERLAPPVPYYSPGASTSVP